MNIFGRLNVVNTEAGDRLEITDPNGNVIVTIDHTNQITLSNLSQGTSSDSILLRNPSTGGIRSLGIGTGLSVSGGNLISTGGGGGGSPGGTDRQVQYNNNGSFGGASNVNIDNNDLVLSVNSNPTAPPSNSLKYTPVSVNNYILPAVVDPFGLVDVLQKSLAFGRVGIVMFPGNSTNVQALGLLTPTATGTATAANVDSTSILGSHRRLNYLVTTAATNAVAGFRQNANQFIIGSNSVPYGGFRLLIRWSIATGQAANATRRFFAGVTSNTAAPTDADPTAGATWANMIAIVADSGDTNFHLAHRSGTGSVTKIDTGIAKSYNDNTEMFDLIINTNPNSSSPEVFVMFKRLSDGQTFSSTISSNLPSATQLLTYQVWSSVGGTSSVIGVGASLIYIETHLKLN